MTAFDPQRFRSDFPVLQQEVHEGVPLVYLDSAASSQRPRQVIEAMARVYEHDYANVHRGVHALSERSTDLFEAAREKVRQFIGAASTEEVIFTSGTTMAINLVARSWGDANLRAGDEILLTQMEHHSNLIPWQQLAARSGARLRFIPVRDDGLLDIDSLDALLGERTRLVSVTAVSNVLGTINPVAEIVGRAHAAGAVVLVDGAQGVPHSSVDVQSLDADFLAFSGHKMLGPSGIGVLYGKRELLEAMPPFLGGGSMLSWAAFEEFEPQVLPLKFEAGTPPIVPAIGLGAAVDYLQTVGMEAIHAHEQRLAARAHELLADVEGLRILGPSPEHKAGVVSFLFDSVAAEDLVEYLDRLGIAVRHGHHCAQPLHERFGVSRTTRASFYLYNTLDEVEQFAAALPRALSFFRPRRSVRVK